MAALRASALAPLAVERRAVMPTPRGSALDVKWRQGSVMTVQLTAVFEKVPEGYIAFVEELPGANTQGATIEEARSNLQEAVELVTIAASARDFDPTFVRLISLALIAQMP